MVALFTSLLSYPFPFLKAGTAELVVNLFRECSEVDDFYGLCSSSTSHLIFYLLFAAMAKSLFTLITFGIKVPAGIFIPSMAVGACLGRAIGVLVESWYQSASDWWFFSACSSSRGCVTPGINTSSSLGTYAIVGAAACLAGVTRMTVSLVVIIFELTGALSYVLPVMLVILIAKWTAELIERESIYDSLIHLNRYPFLSSDFKSACDRAVDIMTSVKKLAVITEDDGITRQALYDLAKSNAVKGFPIVTTQGQSLGYIGRGELVRAIRDIPYSTPIQVREKDTDYANSISKFSIEEWLDKTPMMVHPNTRCEIVAELFKKMGLRFILVTQNGILLGIITKKDLLYH
jgi:chloride channel 3/4/5